jgi:hypothetical protein
MRYSTTQMLDVLETQLDEEMELADNEGKPIAVRVHLVSMQKKIEEIRDIVADLEEFDDYGEFSADF